ncbi:MAG TPA: phenylacetate--CoA ligase family protein [Thermoplasmatales archaeon]|nr:phenylacetate--CoA ligase family protein [Thermoplasmatales archaeon]
MIHALDIPILGTFIKLHKVKKYGKKIRSLIELNPEELKKFQLERLKKILKYAYENVELYRRKWDEAGVKPDDIKSLDDLYKIPITTKDDFRQGYPDKILSKEFKPEDCHIVGTSGSTGSPVKIFLDREKSFFEIAVSSKGMVGKYIGFKIKKPLSIVVTDEDALEILATKEFKQAKKFVFDALDSPENHVRIINKIKPDFIFSYPSVLRNISILVKEQGIKIAKPKLIVTVGETMDPPTRKMIEETFECEILDAYGSTEVGLIGVECSKHQGIHLVPWKVIVELVDENGMPVPPGTPGRVIVTDLFSKATPIIRYSGLGDIATLKRGYCSCGAKTPVLERIEGRYVDSIVLPDRKIIHPFSLTLALQDIPFVNKFQIRQEKIDKIDILIVKEKNVDAKKASFAKGSPLWKKIMMRYKKILGDKVSISIKTVPDIPRRPGSHKYATVVSMLKKDTIGV